MDKKKANQDRFLTALLSSGTVEQACEITGLSISTAYRYLQDEGFNKRYQEERKRLLTNVIGQLSVAGNEAVTALQTVLRDKDSPATAKVSAGRTILEYMFKGIEVAELQERVEELEKRL